MEEKIKKYNKWKSRRWLVAIYLMLLTGYCLIFNSTVGLSDTVLIALIAFTELFLMIFVGYQTKEKINNSKGV